MALIAKDKGTADFAPAPAGTHIGVCTQIIDLGTQTTPFLDKDGTQKIAHQCFVSFELPNEKQEDGQPYSVGKFYTVSLHEKANLRHDLEAWRGRPFTDEELAGFNLKNILGRACMVNVSHKKKADNSVSAVIAGIVALPKGTAVPKPTGPLVVFDIDAWDQAVFDSLGEYWQKAIGRSLEGSKRLSAAPETVPAGAKNADIPEEDIPF